MREFGLISSRIWKSTKFKQLKTPYSRMLYFYLHTNRWCNVVGLFVLPESRALKELQWELSRYRAALQELVRVRLIQYSPTEEMVLIDNWLKFNPPQNKDHFLAMFKALKAVQTLWITPTENVAERCQLLSVIAKRTRELNRFRTGCRVILSTKEKEKRKRKIGASRNGALARHVTAARAPTERASKVKPSNDPANTIQSMPS